MKSLGDLIGKFSYVADDKKREVILPMLQLIKTTLTNIAVSPAPIYAQGLQNMFQLCSEERANFIRETLNMDLEQLPIRDYLAIM